jgi:membrane-associated protease RseP (regulator of RpoE activity)
VRAALGLGVFPTVVRVEPGGAAARAGVKAGDEILAVAGQALAEAASRSSRSRQEGIEEAMARGATDVTVERASRPMTVHIAPEPGCPSEFLIGRSRGLRAASSNGTRVTISPEIIEFAASDDELAFVMAHEFAHNILGHNRGTPATRVSGEDRSGARSRDREHEADRWALYLVARAGYDPSVAPGFWRRWGPRTGFGILSDGSHPDWRDRAARAEAEIARIKVQLVTGQVPVP